MTTKLRNAIVAVAVVTVAGCSSAPGEQGLRDSFAGQLAANRFVTDFQRNGNEMTFSAPGPEGGTAKWRVQIDGATVEAQDDQAQPYKGTIKSSWYADGQKIEPRGRDSGLPLELMSNGLSQEPWAFWNPTTSQWGWE